jgi:hypothetical protein
MARPFGYPDNITGFMDFVEYSNYLTGELLGIGFLIIVGMVAFLTTKVYTWERSLAFSMFLVLISAIFLRIIDLITNNVLIAVVILFALSGIALLRERGGEEV